MTTFLDTFVRDLACSAAALAITLILGLGFVQSTSVVPGTRTAAGTTVHVALHA